VLKRAPDHVPTLVLAARSSTRKSVRRAEGPLQRAVSLGRSTAAPGSCWFVLPCDQTRQRARWTPSSRWSIPASLSTRTMMLAGETYLANGDVRQAAKFFDVVSKLKPQSSMARVRLGQIALLRGDLDAGIRTRSGHVNRGGQSRRRCPLVAAYIRKGDTAKALEASQDYVKKEPKNPTAHQISGPCTPCATRFPLHERVRQGPRTQSDLPRRCGRSCPAGYRRRQARRRAPAIRTNCREGSKERTGAAGTRRGDGGNRRGHG